MWEGIILLETLLGISIENVIILVLLFGGIIFYAVDFTKGVVLNFFMFAILFMVFYLLDWDYVASLIIMFVHFAIMALTIWATSKKAAAGGIV